MESHGTLEEPEAELETSWIPSSLSYFGIDRFGKKW